jgi:hypothetical protein
MGHIIYRDRPAFLLLKTNPRTLLSGKKAANISIYLGADGSFEGWQSKSMKAGSPIRIELAGGNAERSEIKNKWLDRKRQSRNHWMI